MEVFYTRPLSKGVGANSTIKVFVFELEENGLEVDTVTNQQTSQTTSGTLGRLERDQQLRQQRNFCGGPCQIEQGDTDQVRSRTFFSPPTGETSFQNNTQQLNQNITNKPKTVD